MKKNYRLTVSYDGTRYYGWEHQPSTGMTIQGKLENVLAHMLGMKGLGVEKEEKEARRQDKTSRDAAGQQVVRSTIPWPGEVPEIIGAGRTDAGVHAENMICNVFMDTDLSTDEIRAYANRYLPEDICVKSVDVAGDRFHSRYNAVGKTYRYTCYVGDCKPLFDRKYVYALEGKPDVEKMKQAAKLLMGEHDFRSFCSNPKMKKSTVRLVDRIDIQQKGDYLTLVFHGSGFLQYQVRIMTGTLLEVGFGKRTPESMTRLLEAKDRRLAGETAPAQGLCMMKVDYQ